MTPNTTTNTNTSTVLPHPTPTLSYAFFGATNYSKELLLSLIENNLTPKAIFSIPKEFSISYSDKKVKNTNYANLKAIADKYDISYYEIDLVEAKKTIINATMTSNTTTTTNVKASSNIECSRITTINNQTVVAPKDNFIHIGLVN